jgi:hypothetical protein
VLAHRILPRTARQAGSADAAEAIVAEVVGTVAIPL